MKRFLNVLTVLLTCFSAFAGEPGANCADATACYEEGEQNFASGLLPEAQKFFQASVDKGDSKKAAFALGVSFAEQGDYEIAAAWFKKACDAGYKNGCTNLPGTLKLISVMKQQRQGFAKQWVILGESRMEKGQFIASKALFAKACDRKYAPGCSKLGEAEDSLGEKEAAKTHLEAGCNQKDYEGCRLLGVFEYRTGNRDKAQKLFDQGCRAKHYPSCGFLAGLEMKAGHQEKAQELLEVACHHNVVDSCESLAFYYSKLKEDGKAKRVVQKVKGLLKTQCDAGKNEACRRIASLK